MATPIESTVEIELATFPFAATGAFGSREEHDFITELSERQLATVPE